MRRLDLLTLKEIYHDVMDECSKYGKVLRVMIPRPDIEGDHVPGLGKIFIEFAASEECALAQKKIAGRQFNDRALITAFFDPTRFAEGKL